jgi:hypothetical protein
LAGTPTGTPNNPSRASGPAPAIAVVNPSTASTWTGSQSNGWPVARASPSRAAPARRARRRPSRPPASSHRRGGLPLPCRWVSPRGHERVELAREPLPPVGR